MPKKFTDEEKSRAVRMVHEQRSEYPTLRATCEAVGSRLGIGRETLRGWVGQAKVDAGEVDGQTTAEREEVRTTIPGKDGRRAGDLLNRDFTAAAPNRVWVADFTYCRTWAGFSYTAFVVDVFADRIVSWHVQPTKHTELVTIPLRMALWSRDREAHPVADGLIAHSDAGSQGGFNWSSQRVVV